MLDKIKLVLGIDSQDNEKDSLIELYLSFVNDELLAFCGTDEVPDSIKIKMVVIKMGRQGTEALSGYNYSGVSETFIDDYPKDILNSLKKYKINKVRFM